MKLKKIFVATANAFASNFVTSHQRNLGIFSNAGHSMDSLCQAHCFVGSPDTCNPSLSLYNLMCIKTLSLSKLLSQLTPNLSSKCLLDIN